MDMQIDHFQLRLARSEAELHAAQRLRYRVFVEEVGAKVGDADHLLRRERDAFDPHFEHLLLIDTSIADAENNVVGSYRMLNSGNADGAGGFYGAGEFDLGPLLSSGKSLLELGRSCVDARYRGGLAMHLLWTGLADYVASRDVDILFGAASFPGTDPALFADALSHLSARHLAPPNLRARAKGRDAVPMDILDPKDIDRKRAMRQMPSLIKAYLRMGGVVGQGAYIDHRFNTIDVCLIVEADQVSQKYRAEYGGLVA